MLFVMSRTDVLISPIWEPLKKKVPRVVAAAPIESEPHQSLVRATLAVDCEVHSPVLPFEGRLVTVLSRDLVCRCDDAFNHLLSCCKASLTLLDLRSDVI